MTARAVGRDVAPETDAPLTHPTLTIKIEARFLSYKKWARQGSNLGTNGLQVSFEEVINFAVYFQVVYSVRYYV